MIIDLLKGNNYQPNITEDKKAKEARTHLRMDHDYCFCGKDTVLCSNTHWNDLGNLSKLYVSTLSEILDRQAPLKTKTLVTRVKIPWFNADVLQLKRFRRKAERKALKSGLSSDWLAYRKICNRYSALLKSTRTSYYTDLIDQCAGDSRKLLKLVTFPCKDPSDSDLPPHDDPVVLANKFGEF